jgi:rhamnosyltransferase
MSSTTRIAAIVVFYNPDPVFIDNIRCYSDDVETVYVIDNSDIVLPDIKNLLAVFSNVTYIRNPGNLGIATALNIGLEQAIKAGFDFALTMDQDSSAEPGMVKAMLDCLAAFDKCTVGIVSPYYQLGDMAEPPTGAWQEVEVAMASGNLLSLEAFKKVGVFREDYFIDFVDHEYCLRLRRNGYTILRANRAALNHRLGAMTWHYMLWKRVKVGNHPPLRRYYGFRNRFHLHRLYQGGFPSYFRYFYRNMIQEILGVVLFEEQKTAKLAMMWRGYLDYRKGILGKFTA